jgi:NarL family two-component system response regulator LiaR
MIVDDHETLREGMATFLHTLQDLELVGMAADGGEALNVCRATRPDVVLMDLMMPGVDGIDTTRAICHLYPDTRVLVLTSFGRRELIQAALDAGAVGYVLKTVSADELADAIRAVYAGRPVAQSGGSGSRWQN